MSNALRVCRASLRTAQGPGPLGFEAEDSGAVGALKIAGLIRSVCAFSVHRPESSRLLRLRAAGSGLDTVWAET